jgi:drug/metabolite transporter (DMT)-like permease
MRKYFLFLHLAVILAGFTGVFGKMISLNECLLVWYRILFSVVWLFIIVKLFRFNTAVSLLDKFRIAKVGLLITTHWLFFYGSIKYANISIGVVCYSLTSFFTAVFNPLVNKQKLVVTQLLLSCLTLLGIALIFHFDVSYRLGIGLGVISSSFAALYTLYNERLVKKHESMVINYYQMMGGAVGLSILLPVYLYFFPVETIVPGTRDIILLLMLSLFCTVGLYVLFAETLKRIPAFTVNLSFNLEPIYSIVIAFLFFNEGKEVNASFYAGLALVGASVFLQTFFTGRKNHYIEQ